MIRSTLITFKCDPLKDANCNFVNLINYSFLQLIPLWRPLLLQYSMELCIYSSVAIGELANLVSQVRSKYSDREKKPPLEAMHIYPSS